METSEWMNQMACKDSTDEGSFSTQVSKESQKEDMAFKQKNW